MMLAERMLDTAVSRTDEDQLAPFFNVLGTLIERVSDQISDRMTSICEGRQMGRGKGSKLREHAEETRGISATKDGTDRDDEEIAEDV